MIKKKIIFVYEGIEFLIHDENYMSNWIIKSVNQEKKKIKIITFIFCSDEYLLNINLNFLDHDYYTDVITFPYHKSNEPLWGDIFISIDRVRENAIIQEVNFFNELSRVMIHGVLHLIGYNDLTELDKKKMISKENYFLEQQIN